MFSFFLAFFSSTCLASRFLSIIFYFSCLFFSHFFLGRLIFLISLFRQLSVFFHLFFFCTSFFPSYLPVFPIFSPVFFHILFRVFLSYRLPFSLSLLFILSFTSLPGCLLPILFPCFLSLPVANVITSGNTP